MRKPTEKQKKFVQGKIAGKSMRQSALQAGYALSVANNATKDILEHPGTQEAFNALEKAYRNMDINEELLAKKDFTLLFAKKQTMTGESIDDNTAIDKAINRIINIFTRNNDKGDSGNTINITTINFGDKKDE